MLRIVGLFMVLCGSGYAQYQVVELSGGPVKRNLIGNVFVNDHSTLMSKISILNHPDSGLLFKNVTLGYSYRDRGNIVSADVKGDVTRDIVALNYRITLYDVFGEHIANFGAGEIKDYATGAFEDHAKWQAYDDDVLGNLTAVVYVYKVRFKDGTIWHADLAELQQELEKLSLAKIEETPKGK